jgi:catechol 2,3-dioxygenase-like lactoylglutathione lyase family enzyme
MADPLEIMRLPIVPIEPRPEFAATLLRRIQAGGERVVVQKPTVRYFVDDIDAAIGFYRDRLGFEEELSNPVFAMLDRGELRLLLSVPGEPHALPDGTLPEPGGWNRISLEVADLAGTVEALREGGIRLRKEITQGVAVRQALLQDPSGNLVELFEPLAGHHERERKGT